VTGGVQAAGENDKKHLMKTRTDKKQACAELCQAQTQICMPAELS
jgi:hypothetical protein